MASGRTSRFLVSLVRRATSAADGTIDRIPSVPISKRHRSQSRLLSTDATGHVETPVVTKTNPGGGQRDAGAGSAVGAKGEPVKLQICGDVQGELVCCPCGLLSYSEVYAFSWYC